MPNRTIIVQDKLLDKIMLGWTLVTAERLADKIEAAEAYLGNIEPTHPENELLTMARKCLTKLRKHQCISNTNLNTSSIMRDTPSATSKDKPSSMLGE